MKPKTLADLFDGYLAAFLEGAKEASTWKTERIRVGHLRRLLDPKLPLDEVTSKPAGGRKSRETPGTNRPASQETTSCAVD